MLLSDLLPLVLPKVPNCPGPVARSALLHAARDFSRQTHALRAEIDLTPEDPARSLYDLVAPVGTELLALARIEDHAGRPLYAVFDPPETLMFANALKVPATVTMVVMPSRDATEVEDGFVSRWDSAIADGALFRLMSTPNVDWSSAQLAELHLQLFQRAIDEAKGGAARRHTHGSLQVRPQAFV